jgi:ribonuclease HI
MTEPENDNRWKRMMFKGNKVWVLTGDDEKPVVKDNKVLIKYQLNQDHEYWARREAVEPIDPKRLRKKSSRRGSKQTASPPKEQPAGEEQNPPEGIVAYTDGASSGNPGPAGIGVVLRFGTHEKEISRYIGIATNNVAELMAIKAALEAVRSPEIPIRLYTDSRYCLGLLSLGWKAKQNEQLVAAIRKLMKRFKDVKILKVEGHAGIPDNERADRLAREAVTKEK